MKHATPLSRASTAGAGQCICDPSSGLIDPECPGVRGTTGGCGTGAPNTQLDEHSSSGVVVTEPLITINTVLSVKGGLPDDAKERKGIPLATGVLDYFPDALVEVARTSKAGNDQHNPGQPLHWAKEKSTDHADCILRHLIGRGTRDTDGILHSAKVAWRALAQLQVELDAIKEDA